MSTTSTTNAQGLNILSVPFDDNCNNLKRCGSLNRILYILNQYHFIVSNHANDSPAVQQKKHEILFRRLREYGHLVNDYHHILTKHLSHSDHATNIKNFRFIHSRTKIECDINHCAPYHHLNANPLTTTHLTASQYSIDCQQNDELSFYLKLLMSIHVYFVHGVDGGFRSYSTPNVVHCDPRYAVLTLSIWECVCVCTWPISSHSHSLSLSLYGFE